MRHLICAIIFLTLLDGSFASAGTKYVMKDLGALPGDKESNAEAINGKGQIVCKSWKAVNPDTWALPVCRVFLWEDGRISEIKAPIGEDGVLITDIDDSGRVLIAGYKDAFIVEKDKATRIARLKGVRNAKVLEINSAGDQFGRGENKNGDSLLFVTRGGTAKIVEKPEDYLYVFFTGFNAKGQVAFNLEPLDGPMCTALWDAAKTRILKELPDSFRVYGLSDDGKVLGQCKVDKQIKGCIWDKGAVKYLDPANGFSSAWPQCINSGGIVAGSCMKENGGGRAVVWDKDGIPAELPMPGGKESMALDISDAGVIVGTLYDDDGRSKAVMWTLVK